MVGTPVLIDSKKVVAFAEHITKSDSYTSLIKDFLLFDIFKFLISFFILLVCSQPKSSPFNKGFGLYSIFFKISLIYED